MQSPDLVIFSALRSSCIFGCMAKGGRFPHGAGLVLRPTIFVITHGDKHQFKFFSPLLLLLTFSQLLRHNGEYSKDLILSQVLVLGHTFRWGTQRHDCKLQVWRGTGHNKIIEQVHGWKKCYPLEFYILYFSDCYSDTLEQHAYKTATDSWLSLFGLSAATQLRKTNMNLQEKSNQCLIISHVITSSFG